MEEYVYLVVDYENICRLCLHSTGIMSNIFDTTEDKISIKEQIFHVTGLQVKLLYFMKERAYIIVRFRR